VSEGKLRLNLEPDSGSVKIDDYDLTPYCVAVQVRFDAKNRIPIVDLQLRMSGIEVEADRPELEGMLYDMLTTLGWKPPGVADVLANLTAESHDGR
jgi:hypothetical protein